MSLAQYVDQGTGKAVAPKRVISRATFTRPSDTTAYAAGDVVGPVTTPACQSLAGVSNRNGGSGRIVGASLMTDLATVTNGTFRVHIFNKTLTPAADNAAFATLYTQKADYLGSFDFTIQVADSASAAASQAQNRGSISATSGLPIDYVCASGDSGLYAVIVALAAYVPASAQKFQLSIVCEVDYNNITNLPL